MSVSSISSSYSINLITQSLGLDSSDPSSTTLSGTSSDSVSISSSGSQLSALVEQRKSLVEEREALVSTTLESEGSTDSIQSTLEEYDSQIAELDAQIAQQTAQAASAQTQNLLTYSKLTSSASSTKTSTLDSLLGLSSSLSQTQAAASAQRQAERRAQALSGEIEADKSRGIDTGDKESELEELQAQSQAIASSVTTGLNGINTAIIENNGASPIEIDYPSQSASAAYEALVSTLADDPSEEE